ncbi:Sas10/Utp3/C1D family-domain-containing protein [Pestalotiopsis sp. NC0098]|nr:Sas10/Utp3/C1D family-domain-containing protein [Pestalotiopsis sp. NC0098]
MDVTDILPQLERLDGEIDNLEEALEPLLGSLPEVASKLPLLDKSKLYVLVAYALESMLFSSLRLNSVNAKEHAVFTELTRVRQYFEKIKNIENPPPKPDQSLNKEAAIRFIKADLADNKEVTTKLSEMIAKEKARAAVKAAQLGNKRKADTDEAGEEEEEEDDEQDGSSDSKAGVDAEAKAKALKKERKQKKIEKRKLKKAKKNQKATQ